MKSFVYYAPTKVFFGFDAEKHIAPALKSLGVKKVLLHYGGGSIKKIGLYDNVVYELEQAGISYIDFGGVEPNPKIDMVRKGVQICKENGVDFILGIGGGSVSDSAKAISFGAASELDPWHIIEMNTPPANPIPMGLVLTIAAAGSEMSNSCVITNSTLNLKRGCNSDQGRPVFAFMNPKTTVTVPMYHTAAGAVDIMMHTMERYLTADGDTPLTDGIAESVLLSVKRSMAVLLNDPENLEARSEIMWASSLAHNDITGCGRNKTFTCHKIEHDLSGLHDDITHGAGLAVVFPAWCKYVYHNDIDRFYKWSVRIWDAQPCDDKEKSIIEGIKNMEHTFKLWGMPSSMSELGISECEYDTIANLTTSGGTSEVKSFGGQTLGKKELFDIYHLMEKDRNR